MIELSSPRSNLIGRRDNASHSILEDVHSNHFLLLILRHGLRRHHLLQHPTAHHLPFLPGHLQFAVLRHEAHHALAIVTRVVHFGDTVGGDRIADFDDIEPRDLFGAAVVVRRGRNDPGWSIKHTFEALEEDTAEGTGAEIVGERLGAFESIIVLVDGIQTCGNRVVVGRQKGQIGGVLASEVIDLDMWWRAVIRRMGRDKVVVGKRRRGSREFRDRRMGYKCICISIAVTVGC